MKKVVVGGTKTASDFAFDVAGPTASSDVPFEADAQNDLTVSPGPYNVTENTDAGYTPTYSADCSNAEIVIGGSKTCTITNTLKAVPQLKVEKVCVGGKAAETDRFQPRNGGSDFGAALDCAESSTTALVPNAGYNVTEAGAGTPAADLANYTVSYSAACVNAQGLPRGAATPTCTITNTLKAAPQLKVEKVCVGGKAAETDRFQPRNGGSDFGAALDCAESSTTALVPNAGYNVTEAGAGTPAADLANYTVSYSAACVNAQGLPRGAATPTCTITNTLKAAPQLKVEKVCVGGKAADD